MGILVSKQKPANTYASFIRYSDKLMDAESITPLTDNKFSVIITQKKRFDIQIFDVVTILTCYENDRISSINRIEFRKSKTSALELIDKINLSTSVVKTAERKVSVK